MDSNLRVPLGERALQARAFDQLGHDSSELKLVIVGETRTTTASGNSSRAPDTIHVRATYFYPHTAQSPKLGGSGEIRTNGGQSPRRFSRPEP